MASVGFNTAHTRLVQLKTMIPEMIKNFKWWHLGHKVLSKHRYFALLRLESTVKEGGLERNRESVRWFTAYKKGTRFLSQGSSLLL